jgi:hypothetical protein
MQALCAYGVTADRSAELMQKYGDEESVPLSELDTTQQDNYEW